MELSLSKGTLVGVVKDRDPMGNKDRWFVDNGGALLARQAELLQRPKHFFEPVICDT